jgi:hypothetical protein
MPKVVWRRLLQLLNADCWEQLACKSDTLLLEAYTPGSRIAQTVLMLFVSLP